jgi:hypothetical protein
VICQKVFGRELDSISCSCAFFHRSLLIFPLSSGLPQSKLEQQSTFPDPIVDSLVLQEPAHSGERCKGFLVLHSSSQDNQSPEGKSSDAQAEMASEQDSRAQPAAKSEPAMLEEGKPWGSMPVEKLSSLRSLTVRLPLDSLQSLSPLQFTLLSADCYFFLPRHRPSQSVTFGSLSPKPSL